MARTTARLLAAVYAARALTAGVTDYAGLTIPCATCGRGIHRNPEALRLTVARLVADGKRAEALTLLATGADAPSISHLIPGDDRAVVVECLTENAARGSRPVEFSEFHGTPKAFDLGRISAEMVARDRALRDATAASLRALA